MKSEGKNRTNPSNKKKKNKTKSVEFMFHALIVQNIRVLSFEKGYLLHVSLVNRVDW